ncbi:MAG: hypothetical protein AAGD88_12070 [Bacteroidota bacterium]
MKLKKDLKEVGYDLIDSPVRNHNVLQLWLKSPSGEAELYYDHIDHALQSSQILEVVENEALSINYEQDLEYKFNIGLTFLDGLLTSLGLGNLGLSSLFNGGKQVSISYGDSKTLDIPIGLLENYLSDADFRHPNKALKKNANRDRILVITGVIMAKDLKVIIETNTTIDKSLETSITNALDGKIDYKKVSSKKLEMKSEGNSLFPVAVRASRIDWDRGEFKKLKQITDNRNIF